MKNLHLILSPKRIAILIFLVFVITTCAFSALAAEASQMSRGEGGEELSGFCVGDQTYVLSEGDPTKIDSVEFTIDGSVEAGFVSVRLEEDGAWYRCDLSDDGPGLRASCDTSYGGSPTIADVTAMRVVAVER